MLLDEAPLTIDADHAANEQAGGADGMGTRDVSVEAGDFSFHGETVTEVPEWGQ